MKKIILKSTFSIINSLIKINIMCSTEEEDNESMKFEIDDDEDKLDKIFTSVKNSKGEKTVVFFNNVRCV